MGAIDIAGLRGLIAAAQQDHDGVAMPTTINPVSGTDMDAQFYDAVANGRPIPQIFRLDLAQADPDTGHSHLVAEPSQPITERFMSVLTLVSKQGDHRRIVA